MEYRQGCCTGLAGSHSHVRCRTLVVSRPEQVRSEPRGRGVSSRDHHQAADLPADLLALLNGHLLDLGGTSGDPNAGAACVCLLTNCVPVRFVFSTTATD